MNPRSSLTLSGQLHHHARQRPNAPAFSWAANGESVSYAQLAGAVAKLADLLRAQAAPGSVIVLSAPNQLRYPIAFLAILEAGCSVFPISPQAADAELQRAASQSNAAGVIGDDRAIRLIGATQSVALPIDQIPLPAASAASYPLSVHDRTSRDREETRALPDRAIGDLLLQSSGTTSLPKIVRRTGRSLDAAASAIVNSIGFGPDDRVLMTIPLTHSYGLEHGLLAPIWAGSLVELLDGLDLPLVLDRLPTDRITILPGVPSTFEMLSRAADAPDASRLTLRRAYSAGAPLPAAVRSAFDRRFGVNVTQLYGASEIGSVTYNPPDEPFDPASVGRAMGGVSIRILNLDGSNATLPVGRQGQVAIRAESMFEGYLSAASGCIDGYFPTGDLGHLDELDRLYITGRIKLLIDVGGFKVNPLEVEAILQQHSTVAACMVVPTRQSATVFRLKAIVTPRDSAVPVDIEGLRQLARASLAAYKIPRLFEVRESLPRSPSGKLLRNLPETM